MKTVYWGKKLQVNNLLINEEPEKLVKTKEWANLGSYRQCYAAIEFSKNIFVIKSPFDFTLWKENDQVMSDKPQEWFDYYIFWGLMQEFDSIQIQLKDFFFSEEDLEISQLPAYLHDNNFISSTYLLPGKMNISKWFRGILPGFKWKKDRIEVKKGDALYYVQFHTDEQVEFKQFEVSDELIRLSRMCTDVKEYKGRLPLAKLYSLFTKANMKNKILKNIRENTI